MLGASSSGGTDVPSPKSAATAKRLPGLGGNTRTAHDGRRRRLACPELVGHTEGRERIGSKELEWLGTMVGCQASMVFGEVLTHSLLPSGGGTLDGQNVGVIVGISDIST